MAKVADLISEKMNTEKQVSCMGTYGEQIYFTL